MARPRAATDATRTAVPGANSRAAAERGCGRPSGRRGVPRVLRLGRPLAGLYSGVILATYKDQSEATADTLYVAHALLNGLVVGALVGLVGRRSNGARVGAAIIAPLGAFFGYTNAVPLVIAASQTPSLMMDMLGNNPFFPAEAWWGSANDSTWISLLGLAVAAAAGWGLAHVTGNRGRGA